MRQNKRIAAFIELGKFLELFIVRNDSADQGISSFENIIRDSPHFNGWFTEENVRYALSAISKMLVKNKLEEWLWKYNILENKSPKRVGVIMAGNIPLVGFHDFLCVLISGNSCIAKLSSQDNKLLKAVTEKLISIEPLFQEEIIFEDGKLGDFDAVIATGSNNSSRYFEYYFGKQPHIIRKNRNSVAILNGTERDEMLALLSEDIFRYFGLGCRNVSKLYIPVGYDFDIFFRAIESKRQIAFHSKYANNYDYNKAILLVNKIEHFDNGFLLLKKDDSLSTPVSCLNYSTYTNLEEVKRELESKRNEIQSIVSSTPQEFYSGVLFGQSQHPELWDYSDGVDTIEFLNSL